jgi:hypothetical protein
VKKGLLHGNFVQKLILGNVKKILKYMSSKPLRSYTASEIKGRANARHFCAETHPRQCLKKFKIHELKVTQVIYSL